jgi:hypothetical protein
MAEDESERLRKAGTRGLGMSENGMLASCLVWRYGCFRGSFNSPIAVCFAYSTNDFSF